MIRLSSLTLCAALIAQLACTSAFAYEGPQEQELDKSLAQMQAQDAASSGNAAIETAPVAPVSKPAIPAAKKTKPQWVGPSEKRLDEGLQPEGESDPVGDAMVHKLNGGH